MKKFTVFGYKIGYKPQEVSVYTPDEALLACAQKACPYAKSAPLVSGDVFVSTKEKRDLVIDEFSAGACDMETAAVASVCLKNNTPFLAIRSISDSADEDASETYKEENEQKKDDLLKIALKTVEQYITI